MLQRTFTALCALVVLTSCAALAGCQIEAEGVGFSVPTHAAFSNVRPAPRDSEYLVRAMPEPCETDGAPFKSRVVYLHRGEAIGFCGDGSGELAAIAGARRFAIPPGRSYEWVRLWTPGEQLMGGIQVFIGVLLWPIALPYTLLNPPRC